MKVCNGCKVEKDLSEFHRRGNGHQPICKMCRAALDKGIYAKDPVHHAAVRRRRRQEITEWSRELKRGKPCADCGQSFHPVAMQWDHLGTDKVLELATAVKRAWSKARILTEIAKC